MGNGFTHHPSLITALRKFNFSRSDLFGMLFLRADAHAVDRAPDEEERDQEKDARQNVRQGGIAIARRQAHCQLNGQETEERRELDDWIEGDRRRVLERIAHGVAHDRGIMQRSALRFQLNFDNLLRIVPCAARVRHEDGLIKSEDGDGDEIADEEVWLDEREGERREEDRQEDIEHALLRVLGADLHDLLAVFDRSLLNSFEPDVVLDELDRAISSGRHGLY